MAEQFAQSISSEGDGRRSGLPTLSRPNIRGLAAGATVFALLVGGFVGGSVPAFATDNAPATMTVSGLRANGLINPLGTTGEDPVFSWKNNSTGRGVTQAAYELRVAQSESALGTNDVWSSGKVDSAEQLNVVYAGPDLASQTRYVWQVRTWNNEGTPSDWSEAASFETAILNTSEWTADWISGAGEAAQLARWKDYTASVDFTMDSLVMGLYARAADLNNAYMWQLSVADGTPRFRPHKKINGGFSLLENKDLSSFISLGALKTGTHNFSVTFAGATIISTLDGVEIDRRTDSSLTQGYIGFRQSTAAEGPENATIHKVTVTAPDGVLLDTDFSDGLNPFTGGTVTERGLELKSPTEAILKTVNPEPLLRKEFSVGKTVTNARIYASARGVYELSLNGERVGDELMAPGWTDYNKRIKFQTYDVTDMVNSGEDNVLGAMLADGWYSGHIASFGQNKYGNSTSLIAQLRLDYSDGSHEWIGTDKSWKAEAGPLVESDMIMGETYDAGLARDGWNDAGFDASTWTPAVVTGTSATNLLEPQTDHPVRVTEERTPISVTESAPNTWIYDMGQNMVGVAELKLDGVADSTATIRYGEMLNPDGTLYTANLRSAKATDHYTFATTGIETYTPTFTFHGFRYLEITGVSTPPTVDQVTGHVWGSDLPVTGSLTSSSDMLNQLQSNISWGQRGNFLSIPTDTPARDERLGWTGDINVFAPTANYNQDTLTFLSKWLGDLRDSQDANGDLPGVSPTPGCCGGGTGWSDAGVTVPYSLWSTFGDTQVITENYDMMTKFLASVERSAGAGLIRESGGYGDWLHLDDATSPRLLGTAYYSYVAKQLSEMAAAIGKTADAERYADLSTRVRDVFVSTFVAADGTVQGNSQTGYAIAIGMGMIPADRLQAVGDKYVAKLASRDYHLSTGFLGTPWLLPALTLTGHQDVAYRLLNNDTYPSWGYEVASGATTMWERWDSLKPDGTFGDVGMNSFNHYAYGAVGDWMYENIGGITSTSAGYKTFEIAPSIGGGLTHSAGTFASVYGDISSAWKTTDTGMTLDVSVPVNTTATVRIPALNRKSVFEAGSAVADAAGVRVISENGGQVVLAVGSGNYSFSSDPANSGLIVDVVGSADALPGNPVNGIVRVTNTGSSAITGLTADLTVSGNLKINPTPISQPTLAEGASVELPFTIAVPVSTPAGPITVTADVSALVGEESRQFQIVKTVTTVLPAIAFNAITTVSSTGDPSEVATVTSTVSNAAASAVTGHFVVDVPAGWSTPAPSRTVTVKPGGSATADVVVAIPLAVTSGDHTLPVRFVHDTNLLATSSTSVNVTLATPPVAFTDHVDFGDGASETAHAVTSSGNGGTTLEAGLSRRYSGIGTVGSWFSAALTVEKGKPFLIRGIETYDMAQLKSYDVLVNGELVDERLYQRTASGMGLVSFQMLVDAKHATADTVTIRFRFNGKGSHDPSLADVWTMPVPSDTIAPSVDLDVSNLGETGWHLNGAAATLTARDARSGVDSVEYRLTTTAGWSIYTAPVALADGTHEFSYRATDMAGNTSTVRTEVIKVDGTAPTGWGWLGETGRIVTLGQDGGSGVDRVEYSHDGTTWVRSLSALIGLSATNESVQVRTVDKAGNLGVVTTLKPSTAPQKLTIKPGQTTVVEASGFKPGQKVTIELHSTPFVLGTVVADSLGVVSVSTMIPADFEQGAHDLVFVVAPVDPGTGPGTDSGADPGTDPSTPGVSIPAEVLASTGTELNPWLFVTVLLLAAGSTLVFIRRRHSRVASTSELSPNTDA
ncbi:family 78 glycoside hydrolase catalytic domain [Glaciibacter psychrotolerans]|uniref:alpha-L-rhamnosidase n=1 Tax=Glaciibacter psychrotolerans TaxID=670054 RepID=A0A7Z0EFT0_9MICO|nr:family 78 glycoside hydrolase catalytic domain [Leifsonia psychrotolerans]NYJ20862.1 hypothetical protein [Leifsonia psychrotolerans]